MNFKELLGSKTFYTGITAIVGGIVAICHGGYQVGALAIINGLGMIFIKDAIVTASNQSSALVQPKAGNQA
jgi:hypothetical protein